MKNRTTTGEINAHENMGFSERDGTVRKGSRACLSTSRGRQGQCRDILLQKAQGFRLEGTALIMEARRAQAAVSLLVGQPDYPHLPHCQQCLASKSGYACNNCIEVCMCKLRRRELAQGLFLTGAEMGVKFLGILADST